MSKQQHILIVIALCLSGFIFCLLNGNRAFTMSFAVAILAIVFIWFKDHISPKQILFGAFALIALLITLAVFVKSDSSLGRLLIYKISGRIYLDHWLSGIGIGNFKTTYLYYQAGYFSAGDYTTKELLLADNTHFAFNDYLQFIIEAGIGGFGVLAAVAAVTLLLINRAYKRCGPYHLLLNLSLAGLIVIAVAAAFTFVFYYQYFQLLTVLLITIIACYAVEPQAQKVLVVATSLVIMLTLIGAPYKFSYRYYRSLQEMPEIWQTYKAGFRTEAMERAALLRSYIGKSPEYLDFMSFVYASEGDPDRAILIIRLLSRSKVSHDLYERLGNQYYLAGRNKEAESAYLLSVNMVPNRFIPRYSLFLLYKKTGQHAKAARCAQAIKDMPVKVRSDITDRIKLSVRNE